MFEWMTGAIDQMVTLARAVAGLVAVVSIIVVWFQTKALIPVLAAILLAGIALWAVSEAGFATLQRWISQDTAGVVVVSEIGLGVDVE
jgi:hypothetical protein